MGLGDELMAAGEARRRRELSGRRCQIIGKDGRPRWHEVWFGNDDVAGPHEAGDFDRFQHCGGHRSYIDGSRSTRSRWAWLTHRPTPARLPTVQVDLRADDCILVEPSIKAGASPNKRWRGWQALVDARRDLPWAQVGPPGTAWLSGVRRIETQTFWQAFSVLKACRAAVLHEGGLHHAAAALSVPAVVMFGGYISPDQTGYSGHVNLFTGGEPCGWRKPCAHCQTAMAKITVDAVIASLDQCLR